MKPGIAFAKRNFSVLDYPAFSMIKLGPDKNSNFSSLALSNPIKDATQKENEL